MVFSSTIFLFYFLPVFLLVYLVLGKPYKNSWALLCSIFFYAWGAPKFIFVVLAVSSVDYYVVNLLHRSQIRKKWWLALSLILNLGLLAYFKYSNFFIDNLNGLLAEFGVTQIAWTHVALPVGISFFIFQSITYTVDVYRNISKPATNLANYLLYILLFPQLIAGPIVKYNSIAGQINSRAENTDKRLLGFYRFCIGLSKKVLIANILGLYADEILNGNLVYTDSATLWIGMLAYTFQIYYDFSGYSDMAIGLGKMMGFDFPENFNSPYLSKNISEFWRRWHITLGNFMKEYLYIPLGGNRVSSNLRLYFNLWVVFLLSGLWHGASWNFVLWGAYHGFFLVLDRIGLVRILNSLGSVISNTVTFFIVVVGWTIFRIEDFDNLKVALYSMFSFDFGQITVADAEYWTVLAVAVFLSFMTAFKVGRKIENFFFYTQNAGVVSHLILFVCSVALFLLSVSGIVTSGFNPFIYYRF